jgi:hypothetical protein
MKKLLIINAKLFDQASLTYEIMGLTAHNYYFYSNYVFKILNINVKYLRWCRISVGNNVFFLWINIAQSQLATAYS